MIDIIKWHKDNGGFCARAASHALRLLGECMELCISLGAQPSELRDVIEYEINKAENRGEFDRIKIRAVPGEFADVSFLFKLLAHYTDIDVALAEEEKFPILLHRKWEPDTNGVLWRPGKAPL